MYHNNTSEEPHNFMLPGCETDFTNNGLCKLDTWFKLTESVTPDMDSWNIECNIGLNTITFLQFDIIFLVLGAIFILFIMVRKLRRKIEYDYTEI